MHSKCSGLALLLVVAAPAAMAGDPPRRVVGRPMYAPTVIVEEPRLVPTPNGLTVTPGFGTFYPDPTVVQVSGSPGIAYTPAGNFSEASNLAVYGPLSRFRPVAAESVVYERSYGGGLQPAGSFTVYTYPALDPLLPARDTVRLRDFGPPRPGFRTSPRGSTRFLLGQY